MFQQKLGSIVYINAQAIQVSDSLLKLGGRAQRTGALNWNFANLLDNGGGVANAGFYYVYIVYANGACSVKVSASNQKPLGATVYKKVGAFYTNYSNQIHKIYQLGDQNYVTYMAYVDTANNAYYQTPQGFISSVSNSAGSWTVYYYGGWTVDTPIPICNTAGGYAAGQDMISRIQGWAVNYFQMYTGHQTSNSDDGAVASVSYNQTFVVQKTGVDAIQPDWKDY